VVDREMASFFVFLFLKIEYMRQQMNRQNVVCVIMTYSRRSFGFA